MTIVLRFCLLFAIGGTASWAASGVRLLLGLTDEARTVWDGSVSVRGARVVSIDGWRFEGSDAITGASWKASSHPIHLFGNAPKPGGPQPPAVANGVVVWLDGESDATELDVKTAQGSFTVKLSQMPWGAMPHFLGGRAAADRVPAVTRITESEDEEDYPAAAPAANGDVWLAYVVFRHNSNHERIRAPLAKPLSDFRELAAPTGGDSIVARRYSGGAWGPPVQISETGGDVYRPAIAVDGSGRVWVFWSANLKGDFDLGTRPIENGVPGRAIRLTSEAGADVFPAAATDSGGAVWAAWQGWRNGRAAIFAATQHGAEFSRPFRVSTSQADEWNPAVAADSSGRVTVAWDGYRNGNYDIYMRTASGQGNWGPELPAAASARYEAYPSIAYDRQNRLWLAYEEGGERWGKDFGAYDTSGLALYQGRAVRLRVFEGGRSAFAVDPDIGAVLPGVPAQKVDAAGRQGHVAGWERPDSKNAQTRPASRTATNVIAPRNSMPRLVVDPSGRVWVAFRSAHPIWWNRIGTVWSEYLASYDGAWTGPVFLVHSDNLLDNRPAVIAPRAGQVMVIGSSDGRRTWLAREPPVGGSGPVNPFENDLYANALELPAAAGPPPLKAAGPIEVAGPAPADKAEQAAAAHVRQYRIGNLKMVRGEFHRHSEVSLDGGEDGTLIDQWRYALDAAAMDWVGCCDHENGSGREYSWWITQKLTDIFNTPGKFVSMFSYERSVEYPEGHRNVIFAQRGVRPLPLLPKVDESSEGHAPDTQMLYKYLRFFDGIAASHSSGTNMGTDWRDNDALAEPAVEIYQGDRQNYEMPGAPRANTAGDSIGGWRPKGFVNLALEKGYRLAFEASSDHISTHLSYSIVLAEDYTRQAILDAFKKRHIHGATDDILADVRSGAHLVGDAFSTATLPELRVKLAGTAPFTKVYVIKDNRYVYSTQPGTANVDFTWKDNAPEAGKTSYYYVRGEQANRELVWASPMWITYTGR